MKRHEAIVVSLIVLAIAVVGVLVRGSETAGGSPPLNDREVLLLQTPQPLEGCLKCHDKIEPMHRFGPTATLDKLNNGKDALGLTCTACHGGNPVPTTKEEAHVQPRFPREWTRDGKFRVPENSGLLINRESLEFVRFLNPSDLRVAGTTCGSSDCHASETTAVG